MERIGNYITKYNKGKVPKNLTADKTPESLPYLTPDFLRGKADVDFYAVPVKNSVIAKENDVIVLWDGSNAGEIFRGKDGVLASTMTILEFDEEEIDRGYYGYSFEYLEYFLKAKTAGSGIPHADKGVIKRLEFFKPPKPEQQAIAGILTKVDEAIIATQESINATQKLKKALMQNLLTGKMKTDGSFRNEDEFYEDGRLGKIPKGWVAIKGWKITEKITKGQSPKWQGFEYTDSGVLFVTSENVRDGYLDISKPKYLPIKFNEKIKNSQLRINDILVNIVGASIGRTCIFKEENVIANTNQAVCVIRLKPEYNVDYFSNYIQLPKTQYRLLSNSVETARANLSLGDFRHHKFIYPEDKDEQDVIATKISTIQQVISQKKEKKQSLEKLKKSLMQNLLTGKKRVDVAKVNKLLNE